MRTQPVSQAILSFEPTVFGCPSCRHLMFFKNAEPWTLMYGHQLKRYTFECGECGQLLTHLVDEDDQL
jgi:transcription elongation factor Elf1